MAMSEGDRESIETLADILDEKGLSEIEYEHHGLRVRVARGGAAVAIPAVVPPSTATDSPEPDSGDGATSDDSLRSIDSPMVGTFYTAPSPEASPFVQVGDRVSKGQVVCIIEAMKLMNEIESEYDGVVAERVAENAQGVEFGQALFKIAVG